MTGQEVRKLSSEDLSTQLMELRRRIFTLRQQSVTDKVTDLSQFKKSRQDIARMLTELSSRRIAGAPAAPAGGPKMPVISKAAAARKPAAKRAFAAIAAAKPVAKGSTHSPAPSAGKPAAKTAAKSAARKPAGKAS